MTNKNENAKVKFINMDSQSIMSPSETTEYTVGVKPNKRTSSDMETSSDSDNINMDTDIDKALSQVRCHIGHNNFAHNQMLFNSHSHHCCSSDLGAASTSTVGVSQMTSELARERSNKTEPEG